MVGGEGFLGLDLELGELGEFWATVGVRVTADDLGLAAGSLGAGGVLRVHVLFSFLVAVVLALVGGGAALGLGCQGGEGLGVGGRGCTRW